MQHPGQEEGGSGGPRPLWAAHVEAHTCRARGRAPKVEIIEQETANKVRQGLHEQPQGQTASSGAGRQAAPCMLTAGNTGNIQELYVTVALCLRMGRKDKPHVG